MAYTDTHILGFQSLVGDKVAKAVLLVVVKRFGTVEGIDDEKATTRAVVGAEENLDEVHDSRPVALSCEVAAGAKTTNKHSGKRFSVLSRRSVSSRNCSLYSSVMRLVSRMLSLESEKAVTMVSG